MSDNKTVDEINILIEDLSIYSHGDIIYDYDDNDGSMYYIILENNGEKKKKFLFSDSHDEQQLPRNSGVNAITDSPIGHYDDFGYYIIDIPIDSKSLGITRNYIDENIKCFTIIDEYDDKIEIYYLIINYNNQNYCFYLDDIDELIHYLLNVQYFHYVEYDANKKSFYKYLSDSYGIDDIDTQCMTLLTY